MKGAFENILKSSKRKPNLIETDDGSEFVNKTFTNLLNTIYIKRYSRNTSLGAIFAEKFNRTIRYLLKRPVFETGEADWIDILPTKTKKYNN